MGSKTRTNSASRRQALQVMFQQEFLGLDLSALDPDSEDLLVIGTAPKGVEDADLIGEPMNDYTRCLLKGVVEHLEEIDSWIVKTAQNWSIDRMLNVDRNIIRLASFEMAYRDDIPTGVAINEAVEVAKLFGGEESPKFVNGVLGRIADIVEGSDTEETSDTEAPEDVEVAQESVAEPEVSVEDAQ